MIVFLTYGLLSVQVCIHCCTIVAWLFVMFNNWTLSLNLHENVWICSMETPMWANCKVVLTFSAQYQHMYSNHVKLQGFYVCWDDYICRTHTFGESNYYKRRAIQLWEVMMPRHMHFPYNQCVPQPMNLQSSDAHTWSKLAWSYQFSQNYWLSNAKQLELRKKASSTCKLTNSNQRMVWVWPKLQTLSFNTMGDIVWNLWCWWMCNLKSDVWDPGFYILIVN